LYRWRVFLSACLDGCCVRAKERTGQHAAKRGDGRDRKPGLRRRKLSAGAQEAASASAARPLRGPRTRNIRSPFRPCAFGRTSTTLRRRRRRAVLQPDGGTGGYRFSVPKRITLRPSPLQPAVRQVRLPVHVRGRLHRAERLHCRNLRSGSSCAAVSLRRARRKTPRFR
jgi:hypothetical protein